MVVRQKSRSQQPKFSSSWINVGQDKARLRRSDRKKIAVKFCPEFSRARRWGRQLEFGFETKPRAPRIPLKSKRNFDRRMPISLTKRNTESGIGRAGDELPRGKQSAGSRPAPSRGR